MKKLMEILKNQSGVSVIEFVLITSVIAAVIFVVGPSIKQAYFGVPGNPGIGIRLIEQQTAGLDESSKNVTVLSGCRTINNITEAACTKLQNSR